jgi:hypothetical protein
VEIGQSELDKQK